MMVGRFVGSAIMQKVPTGHRAGGLLDRCVHRDAGDRLHHRPRRHVVADPGRPVPLDHVSDHLHAGHSRPRPADRECFGPVDRRRSPAARWSRCMAGWPTIGVACGSRFLLTAVCDSTSCSTRSGDRSRPTPSRMKTRTDTRLYRLDTLSARQPPPSSSHVRIGTDASAGGDPRSGGDAGRVAAPAEKNAPTCPRCPRSASPHRPDRWRSGWRNNGRRSRQAL
ncbi:unnamed protein product [Acanthosepion pharaonis]|uniref:Uncharacterized protein n=1 Tax=Acanthosepion pharaonis TaxID=158019 RepID=A0A812D826_ACAPH|nr:unnamed protein product [Sepia pharaonis]